MSDLEDFDLSSSSSPETLHQPVAQDAAAATPGLVSQFRANVRELVKSPRDLLVVYIAVFLDSLSYYAFSYALMVHLSQEVGLTDSKSGLFYGLFGVCISLSTLVLGFVMDKIGIRLSVCLSAILGLATRIGMAYAVLAQSPLLTSIILFVGVSPSMALMGPALPTAIKRYTTSKTMEFGFSINYGVMNLAAFVASPIIDLIRLHTQNDVLLLPPYALLIAGTALLQIPVFIAAAFGMRDVDLQEDGTLKKRSSVLLLEESTGPGVLTTVKLMMYNRKFWVAVTIALALVGVKSSFRYFDALYLPYVMRAYDDASTFPYMTLLALNPAIVIPLTLTGAITLLTRRGHPVTWIIVGSLLGGIAPIFMAIGPYIVSIILYVTLTSVGEIIWSPITYSYLLSMASTGDEGAWMAIAGMTLLLPKVLTGMLTGGLLSRFCPPLVVMGANGTVIGTSTPSPAQLGGNRDTCWSLVIWGIITLTTMSSFFLLLLFRRFVTVPVAPKSEATTTSQEKEQQIPRLVLTEDAEMTGTVPLSDVEPE